MNTHTENTSLISPLPDRSGDPFPEAPKGVGGWLTFLIIVLSVLNPLANIGMLAAELRRVEQETPYLLEIPVFIHYKWFSWALVLACSAIGIAAGYTLWKKHVWKSVRLAMIAIWVMGPLATVLVALYIYMSFGSMAAEAGGEIIGSLIRSLLFAGIWTAYLLRSKRVRNTYVRESGSPATGR